MALARADEDACFDCWDANAGEYGCAWEAGECKCECHEDELGDGRRLDGADEPFHVNHDYRHITTTAADGAVVEMLRCKDCHHETDPTPVVIDSGHVAADDAFSVEHLPVGAYLPDYLCATCLAHVGECECPDGFDSRNPGRLERILDSHNVLVGVLATFGDEVIDGVPTGERVEVRRTGIVDQQGERLDTVADPDHILDEIEALGPDAY